jgi:DNA helicase-2/ATP-dependent DNA helicase PcrA
MRGVGPKTAERILAEVIAGKKGLEPDEKLIKGKEDIERFFSILKDPRLNQHSPAQLITQFYEYYQPLLKDKYDNFHKRINDLMSLEKIASRYDSLERFLTDMALEPPERSIIEAGIRDRGDSRLTLSTIHSAKGLEWHTVFVLYVADGHLPSYLSLEDDEQIEEERRLLYVALTRAKENLYLLKPRLDRSPRSFMEDGGTIFTRMSRFLDEQELFGTLLKRESVGRGHGEDFNDDLIDEVASDTEFLRELKERFRYDETF